MTNKQSMRIPWLLLLLAAVCGALWPLRRFLLQRVIDNFPCLLLGVADLFLNGRLPHIARDKGRNYDRHHCGDYRNIKRHRSTSLFNFHCTKSNPSGMHPSISVCRSCAIYNILILYLFLHYVKLTSFFSRKSAQKVLMTTPRECGILFPIFRRYNR